MDKVKVNNQVVLMRKFVKQAKVRVMNKLTKDLKMFQNKHGNEAKLQKYKRKSERILTEIEIIKKIKVDSVCKMALLNERDWHSIVLNKESTLDERVFALLAGYDALQAEVCSFREENPNLVAILPELMQTWEQRKSAGGKQNESFLRLKKKSRKMQQKLKNSGRITPKEFNKSSNAISLNDSENSRTNESDCDVKMGEDRDPSASEQEFEHGEMSDCGEMSQMSAVENPIELPKNKNQKEVATIKLEELQGQQFFLNQESDDSVGGESVKEEGTTKRDPFFICSDENAQGQSISESEENEKFVSKGKRQSLGGAGGDRKRTGNNFRFGEDRPFPKGHQRGDKSKYNKGKFAANRQRFDSSFVKGRQQVDRSGYSKRKFSTGTQRSDGPFGKGQQKTNKSDYDRRNLSSNAQRFGQSFGKGHQQVDRSDYRKRKFATNVQGSNRPFSGKHPQNRSSAKNFQYKSGETGLRKNFENRNSNFKQRKMSPHKTPQNLKHLKSSQTSQDSGSLHPSWEAKKKMKMQSTTILPFKGAKIKFDD